MQTRHHTLLYSTDAYSIGCISWQWGIALHPATPGYTEYGFRALYVRYKFLCAAIVAAAKTDIVALLSVCTAVNWLLRQLVVIAQTSLLRLLLLMLLWRCISPGRTSLGLWCRRRPASIPSRAVCLWRRFHNCSGSLTRRHVTRCQYVPRDHRNRDPPICLELWLVSCEHVSTRSALCGD